MIGHANHWQSFELGAWQPIRAAANTFNMSASVCKKIEQSGLRTLHSKLRCIVENHKEKKQEYKATLLYLKSSKKCLANYTF